ncbi:FAD-dependent tricarballylate dehydrogenase TcuA [Actinomadura rubrisoli]|uniref:FAD-dependent tricarballylate dehydrogenase TcuA n=1 Tax=Actinomadura rubrisoli TaxID=2530368 RepID=UPI001FB7C050|nr:FAD-dependent tricarballylate dehydrogenase TcuA [Actinomadura rubrisoli]
MPTETSDSGDLPIIRTEVLVVGGGNAGFTAAHAASARGRAVVLLEKAEEHAAGGNSYYTAGATRIAHNGFADIADIVDPDERHPVTVVPPYPAEHYAADLAKVTDGRNDPDLTKVLVEESQETLRWLNKRGLRYRLMYERQAYERPDGSYLFWGGLHVGNTGGGEGLIADHTRVAAEEGVVVRYGHAVEDLIVTGGAVVGVRYRTTGGCVGEVRAESTILAAGGFESSAEMRKKHLGPGWENAKVRGTPCNTGTLLEAALAIGARAGGDWSTCHSVAWDALADHNESNRALTNRLTRQSYPLGIVVNNRGERFLDEGADFRNYTYAKYGREILEQPDSIAYQIFDATLRPMLRAEEYDMPGISVFEATTIEGLAEKMGVDATTFGRTVSEFNASIDRTTTLDPTMKDGRAARVKPPKSNWASPIETGPFYAYPVTCGITFTFGGLGSDTHGRVLSERGDPIPGLFVCGEMLGGLFSGNYPGGSGLAAGSVFGRRAGTIA